MTAGDQGCPQRSHCQDGGDPGVQAGGSVGFRDGVEGFMFCLFSGVSAAVRAWKHRELTLSRRAA